MIKIDNMFKPLIFAGLLLANTISIAGATEVEVWERSGGEGYRFAEYFAKSRDTRDGVAPDFNSSWQRYDFTFSRKYGWEFYITLRLVPVNDPVRVRVSIDGEDYVFAGTSVFGKMSWKADRQFLEAVMKTDKPIQVEETYGSGFKFNATINPQGLASALEWVGDLP